MTPKTNAAPTSCSCKPRPLQTSLQTPMNILDDPLLRKAFLLVLCELEKQQRIFEWNHKRKNWEGHLQMCCHTGGFQVRD
jgi:hypothetical protein